MLATAMNLDRSHDTRGRKNRPFSEIGRLSQPQVIVRTAVFLLMLVLVATNRLSFWVAGLVALAVFPFAQIAAIVWSRLENSKHLPHSKWAAIAVFALVLLNLPLMAVWIGLSYLFGHGIL